MPFMLTQIRRLVIFLPIIFYLCIPCILMIPSDLFAQEVSISGEHLTIQVQGKTLKEKPPLPSQSKGISLDPTLILQLPPLGIKAMEAEDKPLGDTVTPLRIGVARSINASPLTHGKWVNIQKNKSLWLFGIGSPSAVGLRLHFIDFSLPPGAKIYIYPSSDPSKYFGPYEGKGIFDDGEFWSPTIEGETIILEFFSPSALTDLQTPFVIKEISHIYRNPLQLFDLKYNAIPEVQNCHLDATCYPDWAAEGDAVGRMVFNDSGMEYMCTGTMLDNIAKDFTPYFLTANHCISTERVARTLEVYWFYETPSCNGTPPNLNDGPRSIAAKYLTGMNDNDLTDFTLLQILGAVPRNLTWAGWTTVNPGIGDSVTGIHHPDGDYRRISFGNITESSETNYWSVSWSSGITETGSTGSAIWNSSHQIVGQLSGGNSSCSNTNGEDKYGKFSESYPFMQGFLQGGADDTLEDNDTRDTARLISASSYSNLVVKINDEDWYKVNVPANTCISITLSFTDDFGNIDMELYRGSETTPISSSSTGDENSKQVGDCNLDEPEDYFVRVFLSDGVRNTYRMTVMFNQLPNPGFESGPLNWVQNSSSERDMITQDPLAHSGSWIAWLGGAEDVEDYIYQDVSIPSHATNAYVNFWYWIDTAETTITRAYDTMTVEIRRPSNNALLKTLVTLSNLDTSSHWILSDLYDVSEFIGQQIRLRFNTKNNDLNLTAFWIDDIGLWVAFPISEALSLPISPSGPSSGTKGTSYTYITGESYSNLNHSLEYQFDWKGNGTTDLSSWGPAIQSKTWNTPGSYDIRARARCETDTSVISSWSVSHRVTITIPTETITKPTTPSGPSDGITGLSYSFSTGASSNMNHLVEYQFDWDGDGNQDLSSWGPATQSKTWNTFGTYHVRVRARCAIDISIESAWSNILIVTIIKAEGPDLIGSWTSLTWSCKNMRDGQKCSIKGTLTIKNNGNRNALSTTYVDFYLSDDDTYDEGDISLNKRISTGKIKAQKSKVIKLSYSFPVGQTVKGKYIIAVIDKDELVTEINETNNMIVFGPIP